MGLRVIKPSDSMTVANLVMTLYGAPGSLKTALLSTGDAPVLLDFDRTAGQSSRRFELHRDFAGVRRSLRVRAIRGGRRVTPLPQPSPWISIEDRLPDERKQVAVLIADTSVAIYAFPTTARLQIDFRGSSNERNTWWGGVPGKWTPDRQDDGGLEIEFETYGSYYQFYLSPPIAAEFESVPRVTERREAESES